jgi:hypothetical protein
MKELKKYKIPYIAGSTQPEVRLDRLPVVNHPNPEFACPVLAEAMVDGGGYGCLPYGVENYDLESWAKHSDKASHIAQSCLISYDATQNSLELNRSIRLTSVGIKSILLISEVGLGALASFVSKMILEHNKRGLIVPTITAGPVSTMEEAVWLADRMRGIDFSFYVKHDPNKLTEESFVDFVRNLSGRYRFSIDYSGVNGKEILKLIALGAEAIVLSSAPYRCVESAPELLSGIQGSYKRYPSGEIQTEFVCSNLVRRMIAEVQFVMSVLGKKTLDSVIKSGIIKI